MMLAKFSLGRISRRSSTNRTGPLTSSCFLITCYTGELRRLYYIHALDVALRCSGTNWGGIAEPGVYTRFVTLLSSLIRCSTSLSYDYGASIREDRALSSKFDELKRQGLFLRSTPEFRKTDWIGDSSTGIPGVSVNDTKGFVTLLQNPDTGAGFYILRPANSSST